MRIVTEVRGKRMLCNVKKKKMSPIRIRCSCVRSKIFVFWGVIDKDKRVLCE